MSKFEMRALTGAEMEQIAGAGKRCGGRSRGPKIGPHTLEEHGDHIDVVFKVGRRTQRLHLTEIQAGPSEEHFEGDGHVH